MEDVPQAMTYRRKLFASLTVRMKKPTKTKLLRNISDLEHQLKTKDSYWSGEVADAERRHEQRKRRCAALEQSVKELQEKLGSLIIENETIRAAAGIKHIFPEDEGLFVRRPVKKHPVWKFCKR